MCGIRTAAEAEMAVEYGADALGFVFAKSSRQIDPLLAREIIRGLPPFVFKVGVFVNQEQEYVMSVANFCGLDMLQLHGDESPEYCSSLPMQVIKAFRVKDSVLPELEEFKVSGYLLDTYVSGTPGGTGKTFNWEIARHAAEKCSRVILAGGLNAGNVAQAVLKVHPFAVDVSSGIESGGKKDRGKIIRFVNEIRRVSLAIN